MSTTVAVIGLGVMGRPMALNLLRAGFDVVGHNRSSAKTDLLVAAGGRAAPSPGAAAAQAEVVLTVLPDTPDVEQVYRDAEGVFACAPPGTLLIDCSTIAPDAARTLAADAAGHGHRMLDAPVSGGEQGAVDGTLSVMVGGDEDTVAAAQPVLEAIGSTIVRVGDAGAGQTVKAGNQMLVAAHLQALAEALVLLRSQGVDLPTAVTVLSGGLAGSTVMTRKAPAMIQGEYRPGFRVDLHHKDLTIASETARRAGLDLPLTAVASELVARLRDHGHGSLDHSALMLGMETRQDRSEAP